MSEPTSEIKAVAAAPGHKPRKKVKPKLPMWSFFNEEEYEQVNFVCAKTPYTFFVQLLEFHDNLRRLTAKLQKVHVPKDFQPENGMYCIAKHTDGKWNRAKVLSVVDDFKIDVLYVDYGDTAVVGVDQVAPLKKKYITTLPFQAIECSLFGVKPLEDAEFEGWSENVIEAMYDFCERDDNNLFLKVCEVEQTATVTGGRLYKVVLVDTTSATDLSFQHTLMERGLALVEKPLASSEDTLLMEKPLLSSEDSLLVEKPLVSSEDTSLLEKPLASSEDTVLVEKPLAQSDDNLLVEEKQALLEDDLVQEYNFDVWIPNSLLRQLSAHISF